jgi:thioredoxin-dependent peroxiredoxin
MLSIGSSAPEFQLNDQDDSTVNIKDFEGQKVLLWFYPKASTPG